MKVVRQIRWGSIYAKYLQYWMILKIKPRACEFSTGYLVQVQYIENFDGLRRQAQLLQKLCRPP